MKIAKSVITTHFTIKDISKISFRIGAKRRTIS